MSDETPREKATRDIDPKFSRLAAHVCQSPYFFDYGDDDTPETLSAAVERKLEERDALREACLDAGSFADLPDDMRETFKKAHDAIEEADAKANIADRINDGEFHYAISEAAEKARGPSAEEGQLLALAMLQAASEGRHNAVEDLAAMGQTPGLVTEVLAAAKREQAQKAGPKKPADRPRPMTPAQKRLHKKLGDSPFRKRLK
jgi:hypothetical protein